MSNNVKANIFAVLVIVGFIALLPVAMGIIIVFSLGHGLRAGWR